MNVNGQNPMYRHGSIPRNNFLEGIAVERASVQLDNFTLGHYSGFLVFKGVARSCLHRHGRRNSSTMNLRSGPQLSGFFQMTDLYFPAGRSCRFLGNIERSALRSAEVCAA